MTREIPGVSRCRRWPAAILACGAFFTWADDARAQTAGGSGTPPTLDETVVTASRRAEPNRQISSTVQIISEQDIRNSPAKSVTDLLAENAVGFLSEWTPGQTSINIRGAATDGQGRDFSSQVVVLINGRRAGTANVSKLSLADVQRIEIVRGPASVSYGSQAMGGVINIILRDGRNTKGGLAQERLGSWGLAQGNTYYAGRHENFSYYGGVGGGHRDDFETGKGCLECSASNTSWTRASGTVALGYDPSPDHRFDFLARSDGTYKTGFRGSGGDLDNHDDRYNQSFDFGYAGSTSDKRIKWGSQLYFVHDVDDMHAGSEIAGTNIDDNERRRDILGLRNSIDVALTRNNDLLAGIDLENSKVRNHRFRITNAGVGSVIAPQDNNQRDRNAAVFVEDVQRLLDDRLALRGGVRYTYGETTIFRTPGQSALKESNDNYDQVTYSTGLSYLLMPAVKLRAGYATGFRAPTGSELAADYTSLIGNPIRGNSNLKNESNQQFEIGTTVYNPLFTTDVALYQNVIKDRIKIVGTQYQNNAGDVVMQGLEVQVSFNAGKLLHLDHAWRIFGQGSYNFSLQDHGSTKDSDKAERVYQYQAAVGTTYGKTGLWEVGALGILRGPMWYDTEESLVAGSEPNSTHVHRKGAFWVFNLHARYQVPDGTALYGTRLPNGLEFAAHVNNLFDKNQHPIFIALDESPQKLNNSNGGRGSSMPGREFLLVARQRF